MPELKGSLVNSSNDPDPSSLRGSLVDPTAPITDMPSALRGSLIENADEANEAALLEDYDMPESAAKQLAERRGNPELESAIDPDGTIQPGMLFENPADPTHRRLIGHVFKTGRGNIVTAIHIEGEARLRNVSLDLLHQKIEDGSLRPIAQPEE